MPLRGRKRAARRSSSSQKGEEAQQSLQTELAEDRAISRLPERPREELRKGARPLAPSVTRHKVTRRFDVASGGVQRGLQRWSRGPRVTRDCRVGWRRLSRFYVLSASLFCSSRPKCVALQKKKTVPFTPLSAQPMLFGFARCCLRCEYANELQVETRPDGRLAVVLAVRRSLLGSSEHSRLVPAGRHLLQQYPHSRHRVRGQLHLVSWLLRSLNTFNQPM